MHSFKFYHGLWTSRTDWRVQARSLLNVPRNIEISEHPRRLLEWITDFKSTADVTKQSAKYSDMLCPKACKIPRRPSARSAHRFRKSQMMLASSSLISDEEKTSFCCQKEHLLSDRRGCRRSRSGIKTQARRGNSNGRNLGSVANGLSHKRQETQIHRQRNVFKSIGYSACLE